MKQGWLEVSGIAWGPKSNGFSVRGPRGTAQRPRHRTRKGFYGCSPLLYSVGHYRTSTSSVVQVGKQNSIVLPLTDFKLV
jgi:hypothetical protein